MAASSGLGEAEATILVNFLLMAGERAGLAKAHGMLRGSIADELMVDAGEDALELFRVFAEETGVDVREVVHDFFAERLQPGLPPVVREEDGYADR